MLMTVKEAAEVLGLSAHTLNDWRVKGKGPEYCKLEGAVRYSVEALQAFKDKGKRRSTSQAAA
jgi:predicted site-specific integrase-resolvase